MKNGFVCCTPFHIIVSLHLVKNVYKDEQNDVYISNHFKNSTTLVERLKETGLFNSVTHINDKEISYDNSLLKQKKIKLFIKGNLEIFLHNNSQPLNYDRLFIFTNSFFSVLITDYCKRKYNTEINMVEEGIMTYGLGRYKLDKIKSVISRTLKLFRKYFLDYTLVDNIFLFAPELYSGKLKKKVKKIPPFIKNEEFLNIINYVFSYTKQTDFMDKKYIFFDQSFNLDGNSKISENDIVKFVADNCDTSSLVIKIHPRDNISKYKNKNNTYTINNAPYPWEVIYLNEDINNNFLIAVSSSALFTPKIIFDKEPKIILLYKIFNIPINKGFENFVRSLDSQYTEKGVFVPSSSKELQDLLNC